MKMLTKQMAGYFRDIYNGGNWTDVSLKDSLNGLDWQLATTKIYELNTIAALLYHINFYVRAVLTGVKSGVSSTHHKDSFTHPPIYNNEDWQKLIESTWDIAEEFADYLDQMPQERLWEDFRDGKDGNIYRHMQGVLEHNYYHMGQIMLLKKIGKQKSIK